MACVPTRLHRLNRGALAAVLAFTTAAACAKSDGTADSVSASANRPAGAMGAPGDSMAGMHDMSGMQGMAPMTGDADRDFLRMMSDHHKGLILMAHMTKDRKDGGAVVAEARKLDAAQDKELDRMVTMLEKDFMDPYAPKVLPQHQAMADELKTKSGAAYDRTFYENVIKHHQEAIKMVNDYLPKAKNAMLKPMAEKMKADQAKEIADFQQKIAKLAP